MAIYYFKVLLEMVYLFRFSVRVSLNDAHQYIIKKFKLATDTSLMGDMSEYNRAIERKLSSPQFLRNR